MSDDRPAVSQDPLLARALELSDDVARFRARWAPLKEVDACPVFGWPQLERQLVDLAPSDLQAELVHRLVARTRLYAACKPPEMVLREILCVAALILEDATPAEDADRDGG